MGNIIPQAHFHKEHDDKLTIKFFWGIQFSDNRTWGSHQQKIGV